MSQKWHLLYTTKCVPEGLTREDIPRETGACDAIVVLSIVLPPTGEYSQLVASLDGRTKEELPTKDLWKAWVLMGANLLSRKTVELDESRRWVIEGAIDRWRSWMEAVEKEANQEKLN